MSRPHFRFLAFLVFMFLAGVALCGCSTGDGVRRGAVAGKVTLAGVPVSPATIRFEDAAAGIALAADIEPDGSYQVRTYKDVGLPAGTYQVAVTPGSMKPPENMPL